MAAARTGWNFFWLLLLQFSFSFSFRFVNHTPHHRSRGAQHDTTCPSFSSSSSSSSAFFPPS